MVHDLSQVSQLILAELQMPEVSKLLAQGEPGRLPFLDLPVLTCRALGGEGRQGLEVEGAFACLSLAAVILDDVLDEDRAGPLPMGREAVMAAALLTAGMRLAARAGTAMADLYADTMLSVLRGELAAGDSWARVVAQKTEPVFGAFLKAGAILAGAKEEAGDRLFAWGCRLGRLVQLWDDIVDAFAWPPSGDWCNRDNWLLQQLTEDDWQTLAGEGQENRVRQGQELLIGRGILAEAVKTWLAEWQTWQKEIADLHLARENFLRQVVDEVGSAFRSWLKRLVSVPSLPSR
jgi:hypothetical protein